MSNYAPDPLPRFQVYMNGLVTRVVMDGVSLRGTRDVKIHQPLEGHPTITIEFLAEDITGLQSFGRDDK